MARRGGGPRPPSRRDPWARAAALLAHLAGDGPELAWPVAVVAESPDEIVRYEPPPPMVGTTGDIEALSMWAGQGVALARKQQSAAEIVTELVSRL